VSLSSTAICHLHKLYVVSLSSTAICHLPPTNEVLRTEVQAAKLLLAKREEEVAAERRLAEADGVTRWLLMTDSCCNMMCGVGGCARTLRDEAPLT